MTKNQLVDALNHILNNFIIGLSLPRLVSADSWDELAKGNMTFMKSNKELVRINASPLSERMKNPEIRKIYIEEFEKAQKRSLVGESFEILKGYCKIYSKTEIFERQPWYWFAMLARNTVSHGGGGRISWPTKLVSKKNFDPIRWNHLQVNYSEVGQELEMSHGDVLELLKIMLEFASNEI